MEELRIKQGETFLLNGAWFEDDGITPKPLTDTVLTSHIRTNTDTLIAELLVTVVDEAIGTYTLTAPLGTATWPIGRQLCDIKETNSGNTKLTDTFTLTVLKAITHE